MGNLLKKDIKFYYESALENFKNETENLRSTTESFEVRSTLNSLYEMEFNSLKSYSSLYEFNSDCFSNSEYMNWYNQSKRKLEGELTKLVDDEFIRCESSNEKSNKEFLESNYYLVSKAAGAGVEEYLKEYLK